MRSTKDITSKLPTIFVGIMLVFVLALSWLGWVLIKQDRELVNQRSRDLMEVRVSDVTSALTNHLKATEDSLQLLLADANDPSTTVGQKISPAVPLDGITVIYSGTMASTYPEGSLRFRPAVETLASVDSWFAVADQMEFRTQRLSDALDVLSSLAQHRIPEVRAGALLRMARISAKQDQIEPALDYYTGLAALSDVRVSGVPAQVLGIFGICSILDSVQDTNRLGDESVRFGELLMSGLHPISRTQYEFYSSKVVQWVLDTHPGQPLQLIRELTRVHVPSEAAAILRDINTGWLNGREPSQGVRSIQIDSTVIIVQWSAGQDKFAGHITDPSVNGYFWSSLPSLVQSENGFGLRILDDSGNMIFAEGLPSEIIQASRTIVSAGQTWTITSFLTPSFSPQNQNRKRNTVLIGSLLLVIGLVITSTYFVSRSFRAELALVKLKSDLVSAVSHEFRTPLTSMKQLTEMLASGRVISSDRVTQYYDVLNRESTRLSRLVEGLLNFGRMEAGGFHFVFTEVHVAKALVQVVDEFRDERQLSSPELKLTASGDPICKLDVETFKIAIWNLLDNASKYADGRPRIEVQVLEQESTVAVSVSDEGPGIPVSDQPHIFDNFVRGSSDITASVKGTGLGLALVKRIITEHAGSIDLDSHPGSGSTFTLHLPTVEQP